MPINTGLFDSLWLRGIHFGKKIGIDRKEVSAMRRIVLTAAFAVSLIPAGLFAGPQMTVTLKDSSVLHGELIEMKDGVYRLRTTTLGEVKIPAGNVAFIAAQEEPKASSPHKQGPAVPVPSPRQSGPAIREGAPRQEKAGGVSSDNLQEQQKTANSQVQSMLMDTSFMEKMTGLGQNQQMQDVMQDPEIMEAIQKGDYNFLMNNDKMKELIESPDMQELMGGMSE